MLSVSFMWAFICALWFHGAGGRYRAGASPSRRAARMKSGRISTLTMVSCHSSVSMTARMATASMMLVMMLTMVLLMAFCAPTTSLLRRLINSPTLVLVKKRRRHALQLAEERHAQVVDHAFADRRIQPPLDDRDPAIEDRQRAAARAPAAPIGSGPWTAGPCRSSCGR